MIVAKFGGTSLATPDNVKRVVEIIKADPRRRIIVVSAPGKRSKGDTKVTDLLFEMFLKKERGKNFDDEYNDFAQRFLDIEAAFGIKTDLRETLDKFYAEIQTGSADFITSTGEYFMAKTLAAILGFEYVEVDQTGVLSFKVIRQPRPAENKFAVDLETSQKNFAPFRNKNIVVAGFYGVTPEGSIYTFPRGGSDITGAVIANIADAILYENWTDVDGVFDKDPNKFSDAKHFAVLTYSEVEMLGRNGANVLHPDAINFARIKNIPIKILNTFKPDHPGTLIK